MLEFLKEQLVETQEELKDLYKQRRKAGVEAVGGIENRIKQLKKERKKLLKEIKIKQSKGKLEVPADLLSEIKNSDSLSYQDLKEAKKLYTLRQRLREEVFQKADNIIAEKYPEIIFYRIFTGEALQANELGDLRNLVNDTSISWQRKIMVVAALTLSLVKDFDADRINILIDFINKQEHEVWQRAFTGLVLALNNVSLKTLKMYEPNLYQQLQFLQNHLHIQKAYGILANLLQDNHYKLEVDLTDIESQVNRKLLVDKQNFDVDELNNELNKFKKNFKADKTKKIKRATTDANPLLKKDNLVEIFKTLIPSQIIIENKILFHKIIMSVVKQIDFFDENIHHWFLGFNAKNLFIKKAVLNSKKDVEKSFIETIAMIPSNIIKHSAILGLKRDTPQEAINAISQIFSLNMNMTSMKDDRIKDTFPILSFMTDLFLFEQYYPKKEKAQIIKDDIDLFNSSLIDILIKENVKNDLLAKYYFTEGFVFFHKKEYDKAIAHYQKAIDIKPNSYEVFYNMGNAFIRKKKYDLAIAWYQKAINIKPSLDKLLISLGGAYIYKKEYDKAITSLQKAIDIKLNKYEAFTLLGSAYFYKKEYYKAIESLKKAIDIKSSSYWSFIIWSCCLIKINKLEEAKQKINKAISLGGLGWGYKNLAHIFLIEQKETAALQHYRKSLAAFEDKNKFWKGMKESFEDLNLEQYGISAAYYEEILKKIEENN
ncbi:MAG: tetratricopeptide repeat protein [Chitinophagales bacterium]